MNIIWEGILPAQKYNEQARCPFDKTVKSSRIYAILFFLVEQALKLYLKVR